MAFSIKASKEGIVLLMSWKCKPVVAHQKTNRALSLVAPLTRKKLI
jgi:hypothetical protein